MIDINKKYRYRNGEPARVLCTDGFSKNFPVISMKKDGITLHHNSDGNLYSGVIQYDLIEITLKLDDPVVVWGSDGIKNKRHFSSFHSDGTLMAFCNGQTSFTSDTGISGWDNWELKND